MQSAAAWVVSLSFSTASSGARCNARPVATGLVICVCDWLRDETGLDFCDRSWICNATQVYMLKTYSQQKIHMVLKAKHITKENSKEFSNMFLGDAIECASVLAYCKCNKYVNYVTTATVVHLGLQQLLVLL